jgi:xylulokinase
MYQERRRMRFRAVLAFDLGSSAFRAGLYDFDGNMIADASIRNELGSPTHDRAEHDPEAWWDQFQDLLQAVLEDPGAKNATVKGIAISALTRTQVFVDEKGKALRPAITWRDTRAVKESQTLRIAMERLGFFETASDRIPIGPYHPLARVLWVAGNEPEVFARTRWIFFPSNFLTYRLTGMACWDRIQAGLAFGYHSFTPPHKLLDALELPAHIIPPPLWPVELVGRVRPDLPAPLEQLSGVPVFAGSLDGWCNSLGIGAIREGMTYVVSGTSDIFGFVYPKPVKVAGLTVLPWTKDLFHMGGVIQSGGDCLTWFADALADFLPERLSPDRLIAHLLKPPRSSPAPIFLPYLAGERIPIWEPHVRAAFLGIDRKHTLKDILWAVLEGVAFASRHVLEPLEKKLAMTVAEIRVSGGGAGSDAWCQVRADVTGRTVLRTSERESGLYGASLLALRGIGRFTSLADAQKALVQVDRRFVPNPERTDYYNKAFHVYRDMSANIIGPCRTLFEARETVEEARWDPT